MNKKVKKIAIVGPESTGKSTLSKQLAQHYNVPWVPEYARYYCANLTAPCTLQDEINMFHGQVALEDAVLDTTQSDFLVCDTTFITIKIWSDAFFGKTPQFVIDALYERPYDLYLLMDIDLPWEDDPLRDFPNQRAHFMQVWKTELAAIGANYKLVGGTGTSRFNNAVNVVQAFLNT